MADKKADLAGPGIGDYTELEKILPQDYSSLLNPKETQNAIYAIKDYIEENMCKELNLIRVTVTGDRIIGDGDDLLLNTFADDAPNHSGDDGNDRLSGDAGDDIGLCKRNGPVADRDLSGSQVSVTQGHGFAAIRVDVLC